MNSFRKIEEIIFVGSLVSIGLYLVIGIVSYFRFVPTIEYLDVDVYMLFNPSLVTSVYLLELFAAIDIVGILLGLFFLIKRQGIS
ncbi:MAG: hypothetical protein ACREGH_01200, partial [Minisyncoccia bacterium]